jgi:FAD binding domain
MTQIVAGHSRCSRYLRPICNANMTIVSSETVTSTPVCILGGGPVGLLLSSILSGYGVKHCIIERREVPTKHPQAHFMNARTMEILQAHLPLAFQTILRETPQSRNWRYLAKKCQASCITVQYFPYLRTNLFP